MHMHQFKFVLLHIYIFLAISYNKFQRSEGFYDSRSSGL